MLGLLESENHMAYADPQSVTIGGSATPLARTGMTMDAGSFTSADRTTALLVRQNTGKRARHNVVLKQDKTISDPLIPAQNRSVAFQVSLTVDTPSSGVSSADAIALAKALVAWATDANLAKLVGGEA